MRPVLEAQAQVPCLGRELKSHMPKTRERETEMPLSTVRKSHLFGERGKKSQEAFYVSPELA